MKIRDFAIRSLCAGVLAATLGVAVAAPNSLSRAFVDPPNESRPWTYLFWMEGSVTKAGITAELEAMAEQGVAGFLFMDGALGNPLGPHRFMSKSWRDMFKHMVAESARLGIEVNLNNAPGWAGSGGPWVKPHQATQKVIFSETFVSGGTAKNVTLPKPAPIRHDYYQDIAVLAYPVAAKDSEGLRRIDNFGSTKSFAGDEDFAFVVPWPREIPMQVDYPEVPAEKRIASAQMQNLTGRMDASDQLNWTVPAGDWLVLRIGHSVANGQLRSAQAEANGLESDKLSKAAIEAQFEALVGRLGKESPGSMGTTIVSTHIDSWESGANNWTQGFDEEFRRRRGYDLMPYMPTLAGIVVDSLKVSERFLWDYRETVTELLLDNYAGHLSTIARKHGMRLSIEAHDGTSDDLRYAGRADEPMSEAWQRPLYNGLPMTDLTEGATSAAHVYGKPIIGAETFTARWGDFLDHPAVLKPLGDWALSAGINRILLTEWIMQPWPETVQPGVMFRDLGTVFSSAVTWWPHSLAWHEYLARAQHMLRQGTYVADICFLNSEGAPKRFVPPIPATQRGVIPTRQDYSFDACPPELVLSQMAVEADRVTLPSGMKYRLLVLPTYAAFGEPVVRLMPGSDYYYKPQPMNKDVAMTPPLLRKIKQLLEQGATVLGTRPLTNPSLVGYPESDAELQQLADEIWGEGGGYEGQGQRQVGQGQIFWGKTPEQVFADVGLAPDFSAEPGLREKLNYIHRRLDDGRDSYFIVNQDDEPVAGTVTLRASGQPQWWWPQTGRMQPATVFEPAGGLTHLPISLNARESVFVVFDGRPRTHLVSLQPKRRLFGLLDLFKPDGDKQAGPGDFRVAAWAQPAGVIPVPSLRDGKLQFDEPLKALGVGSQVFSGGGQGLTGFGIATNVVVAYQIGQNGDIEPLVHYELPPPEKVEMMEIETHHGDPIMLAAPGKRIHIGVVYEDHTTYLFVDGRPVAEAKNTHAHLENMSWADEHMVAGDVAALDWLDEQLRGNADYAHLARPKFDHTPPAIDSSRGLFWASGDYKLGYSDGRSEKRAVELPDAQELSGTWDVRFEAGKGAPETAAFAELVSWPQHAEEGVRYYSGEAVYRKSFQTSLPRSAEQRVFLDLGEVGVIAEVSLNGTTLGTLWNAPYRVDVTEALRDGDNALEVTVVNTWVNRMIGDEHLPEDTKRKADRSLAEWPQWLEDGKSSPTGRHTFATWRIWQKEDPLVPAGLIGPVRLLPAQTIQ